MHRAENPSDGETKVGGLGGERVWTAKKWQTACPAKYRWAVITPGLSASELGVVVVVQESFYRKRNIIIANCLPAPFPNRGHSWYAGKLLGVENCKRHI